MTEIIGVRFKPGGKQYYFDPQGLTIQEGDGVIVETGKGLEYGDCVRANRMVEDDAVVQPLRPVVRLATNKDLWQVAENKEKEEKAMKIAQKQIERHGLDMKLVSVEYCFDGSKIVFFFTSDGRVDFRALVKDLAGIFRARIELRQIGVRDEARMLGGLGICGKPFCCAQFLDEFQPVSIKMAKTQNLSLNPTKISGACGRLMCCLKYEQDAYEDAVKRVPKQDSFVECPDGVGTVSAVNLLKEQVKVRLDDSTEQPKSYYTSEIRVVRSGKGKRPEDYVAPPPEELEKLRYIPPEEDRPRRLGDPSDLSAALEQYLGVSAPEEEKKSDRRRRRSRSKTGPKPESQPAKAEAAAQPRQPAKGQKTSPAKKEQPKKDQPKKDQPKKDQPKKDQSKKDQPKRDQTGRDGAKKAQAKDTAKKDPPQGQPRKEQTAQRSPAPEGGEGKPANKKRHYRPRHRPKKPGEGGGPANG